MRRSVARWNAAFMRQNGPGPPRHKALGVILFSYLRIKLALKLAGYDADFHPFDWRQSIDGQGQDLAKRIAADPRRRCRSSPTAWVDLFPVRL